MAKSIVAVIIAAFTVACPLFAPGAYAAAAPTDAVAQVIAEPDGASVSLADVLVQTAYISPASVIVRDAWVAQPSLTVALNQVISVTPLQPVYVEGTMTTLPGGEREIEDARVWAYTDPSGTVIRVAVPGLGGNTVPGTGMVELTSATRSSMSFQMGPAPVPAGSGPVLAPAFQKPTPPRSLQSTGSITTIGEARAAPDGTAVDLTGKVVTRNFGTYLYVQEQWPDPITKVYDNAGIRTDIADAHVYAQNILDVQGTVETDTDGERYIHVSAYPGQSGTSIPEVPVVSNRALICGSLAQQGGSGTTQGPTGGQGTYIIGDMVKTMGQITAVGSDFIYIWDGSNNYNNQPPTDDTGNQGIRVEYPAGDQFSTPPAVGDYITLTAIAGLRQAGGAYYPVLRLADPLNDATLVEQYGQGYLQVTVPTLAQCGPDTTGSIVVYAYDWRGQPMANASVTAVLYGSDVLLTDNQSVTETRTTDATGRTVFAVYDSDTSATDPCPVTFNGTGPDGTAIGFTGPDNINIAPYDPVVTASITPDTIYAAGDVQVNFAAKHADGSPASGVSLTLSTNAGVLLQNGQPVSTATTGTDGTAAVTLSLNPAASATVQAAYTDTCGNQQSAAAAVTYRQTPWQNVGVGYSSPLVADLIPGAGPCVAVVGTDGLIHLWKSDGTAVPVSSTVIDSNGDNTISAGGITGDGTLQLFVPTGNGVTTPGVYAFGYDASSGTFKPVAGWPAANGGPTASPATFSRVAAPLADVNLDGTTQVVASDTEAVTSCWSPAGSGGLLWRQVADDELDTTADATNASNTVAIGGLGSNASGIPAVVTPDEEGYTILGFQGDEWRDFASNPASPPYSGVTGWAPPAFGAGTNVFSPVLSDVNGDGKLEVIAGTWSGYLWIGQNGGSSWTSYQISQQPLESSPAISNLDGTPCIIVGSDDGRVYAVHADGTPAAGWNGGILLDSGYKVVASPLVGDVMGTGTAPQVIAACTDGNVYAIWADGNNHTGAPVAGPIAQVWTCAQTPNASIEATPTLCSLTGSGTDLIVGSTDGIYDVHTAATFDPGGHPELWPWTTFHYNAARTGLVPPSVPTAASTPPDPTLPYSSIIGRVVSTAGVAIEGATVRIIDTSTGQTPVVAGQPNATRNASVTTVGDGTPGDEINEGGYVVNQLPNGGTYTLTVSATGYQPTSVSVTTSSSGGATHAADIVLAQ